MQWKLTSGLLMTLLLAFSFTDMVWAEPAASSNNETHYSALADTLENEQAREKLITELRDLAEAAGAMDKETDSVSLVAEPTFARQIANKTQAVAQEIVSTVSAGFSALTGTDSDQESAFDWQLILDEIFFLVVVIAATLLMFYVLRSLARHAFRRANNWAEADGEYPVFRKFSAILLAAVVDLLTVILAWVAGYAVALFAIGSNGEMNVSQSLFLNAFLAIEIFKVILRTVFAGRDDALRLLPISAESATYWHIWLVRLTNYIGYGMLLVVPLVNLNINPVIGQLVSVLVVLSAFIYAVLVIMQNRMLVKQRLLFHAQQSTFSFSRVSLGILARSWHVLGIVYFAVMAGALLLRPEDALPMMLKATFQTILALVIGGLVAKFMAKTIGRPVHVSDDLRSRFPLLEERLNGFVPNIYKTLRILLVVVVAAVILDAWGIFSLSAWLASDAGIQTIGTVISVAAILVGAMAIWIALASWIEHRLNPNDDGQMPTARAKTLLTIFRNAAAIALIIMTVMIVLAEIGVNIGPLLAGAGVLGLAIGFGAQKLVQDVITGVFIQMENAINAGDIVTAGGITGTAEKLTIRSLGLRDLSGTYHMIPFSAVDTVSNFMREFAYHVGEYGVAYRENTDEVIVHLREAFAELMADPEQREKILIDELEVHGVTALADSSVNIRVRIKTLPGTQWGVGRAYNRLVKQHLDAAGIEIPFPHMTIYFGQDKDGSAPPAPLKMVGDSDANSAIQLEQKPEKTTSSKSSKSNPKHKQDFDEEH
ncbi:MULTISPECIES: mechanosensitive ion channel domain-containing protein [unclassified Methylophaga]|jgi:small conductance mechanosensitive channel|uniref:mechanosensitive ion channel domain-containing protein n=2 Tax=Methylophaga TaxID=40222 RepID=UPI0025D97211|nr:MULTISPECIES: mechanosensitive ion channel domain-containing protein [unclassified Methylophaga]|tara:strand:+ start:60583 stop:62886 length:2304 start_codon:yes stop_codon:yes gene_type:complete